LRLFCLNFNLYNQELIVLSQIEYLILSNEFKQLSLEYPIKTQAARVYKIIDLFAGIGGIRTGFQQAFKEYAQFVFSSEIDKFSAQTYQANYGELPVGDITQINETEIPTFDILLAGFPVSPFLMQD
jgi:DNA (cytosine-5)-methyltransferase 1